jgi:putative drug exporter of the RND superfamily
MLSSPNNVAARAGRWSVRHRRRALISWLVFVVLATMVGGSLGLKTLGMTEWGIGESGRADDALNHAGFAQPAHERVLLTGAGAQAAAADLAERLDAVPAVAAVADPITAPRGGGVLVEAELRGRIDDASDHLAPVQAAVAATAKAHPDARLAQSGDASIQKAGDDKLQEDFQKAELSAVPLTLIILTIVFGAVVAALVPLGLGLTGVMATIGLIAIPSQLFSVVDAINSIVLLIGLAIGVDYALFYLRREREERAAGRDHTAAIEAAAATSGHAVLVSGATVTVAVAGMFLSESPWYRSFALGIITAVLVAMAGSVTVLPALLSWLGDRVEKGRIPFLRRSSDPSQSRIWGGLVDRVLKRPAVSAIAATAVLLALAAPVLGMRLADQGLDSLSQDIPAVKVAKDIQQAFPGGSLPAVAVVQGGDLRTASGAAALGRLEQRLERDARFGAPVDLQVAASGDIARVSVPLAGTGTDAASEDALRALRADVLPAALGPAGLHAQVTGPTAASVDGREDTWGRGPLIVAVVLTLMAALLMVTFRSIVVPLKAIALNLLSVAASYGVLVLIFQHGWGAGLLGVEATGAITTWIPTLIFLLLFGLSMDYHVFILSRIREAVDRGMTTADAVRHGLRTTAGVVTSAAVVMVGVFGIFATLSQVEVKQMGIGLAVAVLIDATIVRAVLLPAAMVLLGERNWWLPAGLKRRLDRRPALAQQSA